MLNYQRVQRGMSLSGEQLINHQGYSTCLFWLHSMVNHDPTFDPKIRYTKVGWCFYMFYGEDDKP